ncbi:O-antigen ligase [Quadrisphaera sp. DSM 44207]|uniref:O-antigen ligase family protein n=1 Tax=Quadrisphaera sp. DSM 44207 TaxID=1881057 RepID=UPI00088050BF|nr:O-antigen ligase family protein [Quadrisphaera sp. DSM 44207]SDQ67822.1 O-antigen ligase [Quadrisphaera sp. DSM 44207]
MTALSGMPRSSAPALLRRATAALGAVLVLLLCVDAGVSAGTDGFGVGTLLRIAVLLGGLLAVVCLSRFEYFVLGVLVVRPALDITKTGGGGSVLASAVAAAIVLGAVLWLAAQVYAGTLRRVSLLSRVLIVLLAVMTLSALLASDPVRSALQVARLAAAVAVLLVVEQLAVDRAARWRVLTACYASAVLPLLVGVQQQLTGSFLKQSSGLGRITGTFVHPNAFGFYLVLLLTMGAAVFRHLDGRTKLLVGAVLVLGTVELVLSYSRGSWISIIVGVLVVGALQARKLLVLLPVALGALVLAVPSVLLRLSDLTQEETVNGTPGNSFMWRITHWQVVLRGARGHELLGLGPGSSDFLGDEVLPPHNDFVRMYVETGVVGTALYLAFILAALATAFGMMRAGHRRGLERGIAVGAIACTAAFVVGSIGGNLISEVVVLLYLFAFLGLASGTALQCPAPQPPRTPGPALAPAGAGGPA